MKIKRNHQIIVLVTTLTAGLFLVVYFFMPMIFSANYELKALKESASTTTEALFASTTKPAGGSFVVTHVPTPEAVKAIYMTSCVSTLKAFRQRLVHIADTTEVNSIIIDVKDYSGTITFFSDSPLLKDTTGKGCRSKDLREFIGELHKKGIYVIARITVFQDPYYTNAHPELAVKRASDGAVWKDRKGLSFIDVSAKPYWGYIVEIGKESYAMGFDELNFDYIRFPSDGNMKDISFTWGKGMTKPEALEHFFSYLHDALSPTGVKLSADLFGMTATNNDDLNIGQVLERALPYFDYVSPMVYPSHYPPNFNGWKNPNDHVYDVIFYSMSRAAERAVATSTPVLHFGGVRIGTSTPALYTKEVFNRNKLRPWIQDFNYGGIYGPVQVRAEIQATYDSGLTSWLIWDPKNLYTVAALKSE